MLWPTAVSLDGVELELVDVLADVSLHAGRVDAFDEPTASTCQLVLRGVDRAFTEAFSVGVELVLTVGDGVTTFPRFTGVVTDGRLDDDELTIIAAGRLSTLARYPIGSGNWPAETWSARVARIFTEAGLAALLELVPDPAFDPQLAARNAATAGETTLGDYLAFLAPMVGCAVVDKPDGGILVQAIGARELADAVELEPELVAYAPPWTMQLPGANVVTVRYQADQGASVTVRDEASISGDPGYGERPVTIDTTFVNAADATTRANERVARSAFPSWAILEAPVLAGLELEIGTPLRIVELPASSPDEVALGILEGWNETIAGDDWTMQLALSNPITSGLSLLPWVAVPVEPEYLWNTIDPDVTWADARTLDDLAA